MSDEKVLTKEIAEKWIADRESALLSEFTAIEDDAAEVLCLNLDDAIKITTLGSSKCDIAFAKFLCDTFLEYDDLNLAAY